MAVEVPPPVLPVLLETLEASLARAGRPPGPCSPSHFAAPALAVLVVLAVLAAAAAAQGIPEVRATGAVAEEVVPQTEILDQMDLLLQMLMLDNQQLQVYHQELSLLQQQHIQSL
jgi:hypothetical protein